MKTFESQYLLRKMCHEDFEDIVEMCKDVWEGSDYLPDVFHDWVEAAGVFLAVVDTTSNRVIGCAKYTILDDGKGWMEGLRVKSDYRGQKIASVLTDALLDIALKDHEMGVTPAVGYSTHITSKASLKLMGERHFKKISDCLLIIKPYETWETLSDAQKTFNVESWLPSYEEFVELPFIKRREGIFNFAFVYQTPTKAVYDAFVKKGVMIRVNGYRGFYQHKGEPNFLAIDESFEAIDTFANYAIFENKGKGRPDPLSYILGDDQVLNETFKAAGYISLNDWNKDYFYFLYQKD